MGLPAGTAITWYGHSCFEITTARRPDDHPRPVLRQPDRAREAADTIERCDLLLVDPRPLRPHGQMRVAIAARLRPAWPCIHEMSLWLARQLPGGADQVIGMNKGGTVEAAGLRVTMTTADHSAGDWNAGGETTLYLGDPVGFVIELEDGARLYFAGDTTSVLRHDDHPRPVSTDGRVPAHRRPLHDGPGGGRHSPSSSSASATSSRCTTGRSRS